MWTWLLLLAVAVGIVSRVIRIRTAVHGLRASAAGGDDEAARLAARAFHLRVGSLVVLLVGLLVVLVVALVTR